MEIKDIELTTEPYTYDNIINQPILKPISETDRSIKDLQEIVNKKLIDIDVAIKWVNETSHDIPIYQESPYVSKLFKISEDTQDIIKFQDLQIKNLKRCISEIVEIVRKKYGVLVLVKEKENVSEEEGIYSEYIDKVLNNPDEIIVNIAKEIKKNLEEDQTEYDEKTKFHNACIKYYKDEADKKKKEIAGRIMRIEIN